VISSIEKAGEEVSPVGCTAGGSDVGGGVASGGVVAIIRDGASRGVSAVGGALWTGESGSMTTIKIPTIPRMHTTTIAFRNVPIVSLQSESAV
jgi:hypothetical protein